MLARNGQIYLHFLVITQGCNALGHPYLHKSWATMIPSIIGYHDQFCLYGLDFILPIGTERFAACYLYGLNREVFVANTLNGMVEYLETRLPRHHIVEDVEILVVGTLGTIYQRTTLNGNAAVVIFHGRMSLDCADRHVEMDGHLVTFLPLAVNDQVARLQRCLHLLPVHSYAIAAHDIVVETVES